MAAPKKSTKPATKAVKSLPKKSAKGAGAVKGGVITSAAEAARDRKQAGLDSMHKYLDIMRSMTPQI